MSRSLISSGQFLRFVLLCTSFSNFQFSLNYSKLCLVNVFVFAICLLCTFFVSFLSSSSSFSSSLFSGGYKEIFRGGIFVFSVPKCEFIEMFGFQKETGWFYRV